MCEVTSWIPNAVAATLCSDRSAQPIIAWLTGLRASIEEYDPLITVRAESPESEESSRSSPDSAFDDILSQLGKEIFKLDEYQRNLAPEEKEVSLSILNIFDECIQGMTESKGDLEVIDEAVETVNGVDECSDGESIMSDVSFVTSTPARSVKVCSSDTNSLVVKGEGTPEIPRKVRLRRSSSTSSGYDYVEARTENTIMEVAKRLGSDSDSESTNWSYRECSTDTENEARDEYAVMWSHSSGFHNSDEILRRVVSQHHATVSRLSFDTANDFEPARYSVYALQEVGGRCVDNEMPVAAMTPDRPTDDGYEPVRDALTDENIYEEIEFGLSYTDEGCSCGGSVEVESCSISASSEGVSRESPLYENLRDHDAYAIPPDVIFWKNLLFDPYYNDDEEDEWITPEECAVYSRDARPPLVIPRITQYRPPRRDHRPHGGHPYTEESLQDPVKSRQYDWSPSSERSRADIDRSFSKASSDSPPFGRINKRLGNSTETLLFHNNVRRPNQLHLPASSSGDSLDVEIREREPSHSRSRKSKSMMATKNRMRSPVPAPRLMLHQTPELPVVFEGPVKRTKFSENGKKSRKNWADCYVVLTHTGLVFYKDRKTYIAATTPPKPGTPPSPTAPRAELVLPLRHASVDYCMQMHTRRYTKSLLITVGRDQYLIQDESEANAATWLYHIKQIIYKMGPPAPDDFSLQIANKNSSTDLESLGRTPPPSRHNNRNKTKVGGSSNEDLSDSTEISIQKTQVKSRLKKFFAKRPAMEVLVKKGIYKDEPVFGRKLEEVCPEKSPRVPNFVVTCIKEIESNEENMCTDGLYRASGNLSQVQKIRLEIDQNNISVIENNTDIHVLTGSLKLFFRELKEPLIPCSFFDRVLAACSIKPKEAKVKEFRDIVQALPQCNRDTLKFLLEHLLRVTQYSERNRMHTANLAIVFGPTLLWAPAEQAHNIAIDCIQQNNVVEFLLNELKDIFSEDTKGKKKV
ncbi:WW domain-containing protein tag-325-like isoform X2 [Galleria mellonella]|uniref:WW domain-containing protein tag-325-like isoform X2 n=1 Tax=Galleria mellonella TaxID=7137 RepID=A0ABM3MKB7_GALME|nr:WW domain-containing protein tag-325-like isoform X2 [Galleria mellonella]